MNATRSTLIRTGETVRVLRLSTIGRVLVLSRYQVAARADGWCRYCGCTDLFGCPGGCGWVDLAHTICSRCFTKGMLP